MANKRQRKKQEKKQLQNQLRSRNIVTKTKNINQLRILYNEEQQKEIKRQKKEQQKKNKSLRKKQLRNEKFQYMVANGADPFSIPTKDLDKSWDFIKEKYGQPSFDFNQICQLKDNERMFVAFRDYAGEADLNEILNMLDGESVESLLDRLTDLVNTPPIHSGKGSGSSGKAGDFKLMIAEQHVIEMFNRDTRNKNRRKPKKKYQHTGEHKGYQVLKSNGRVSFNEYTPRKMLCLAVAIMDNVTEGDRTAFYSNFYKQMQYHNPDFANQLPTPKY